jgi:hypothetical protein
MPANHPFQQDYWVSAFLQKKMGRREAVNSALYYIPFILGPRSLFSSLYMLFLIMRKGRGS